MKSAWFGKALLLSTVVVSLYACKDKTQSTTLEPAMKAGKGGMATMRVVAENSGINVDSGMVYIKYNTSVTPVDGKYDDSAKIKYVDNTAMAIFTELKTGNYFFAAKGWDIIRSQTVYGTRPYTIQTEAKTGTSYLVLQTTKQ
ncbi:MAG: hypothetical protein JNK00_04130 [Flavipsychrobacter sp.]|nr:hypothetical protein [Flavipsychrobacter sp.]